MSLPLPISPLVLIHPRLSGLPMLIGALCFVVLCFIALCLVVLDYVVGICARRAARSTVESPIRPVLPPSTSHFGD